LPAARFASADFVARSLAPSLGASIPTDAFIFSFTERDRSAIPPTRSGHLRLASIRSSRRFAAFLASSVPPLASNRELPQAEVTQCRELKSRSLLRLGIRFQSRFQMLQASRAMADHLFSVLAQLAFHFVDRAVERRKQIVGRFRRDKVVSTLRFDSNFDRRCVVVIVPNSQISRHLDRRNTVVILLKTFNFLLNLVLCRRAEMTVSR